MKIENQSIAETFAEFKISKNVNLASVQKNLNEAFIQVIKGRYRFDDEEVIKRSVHLAINLDVCDFEIQNICEVVADEEINDAFHIDKISLSYAKSLYKDIIVGEKITLKPSLASLVGRRNVIEIRQILIEKVRDLVYNELYEKYKKIAAEFDTGNQLLNQKKQILVLAALL